MMTPVSVRACIGTVLLVAVQCAAAGEFEDRGKAFCYELEKKLNYIVDYTRTACIPTVGAGNQYSFILISEQPVFSVETSKQGWVIGIVGVAGSLMNQDSSLKVDKLVLSDANQMKQRVAYSMSATAAKSMQRRAKADQLTFDQLRTEAMSSLRRQAIPETRSSK